MRQLSRNYLQHARRHLPQGSDPLPFQLAETAFHGSYALFSGTITSVPSETLTTFDLSTAVTVSQSEAASTTAGTSWTATNFSYDTSDPNSLHILTQGTYVYEAVIEPIVGIPTGSFSALIKEEGILYQWGVAGSSAITQQYFDSSFVGGSVSADPNVFRHATYYFGNPGSFPAKRGISFAHDYGSAIDVGVAMVVFRIAPP